MTLQKEVKNEKSENIGEVIIEEGNCIYVLRKPNISEEQVERVHRQVAELIYEMENE